MAALETDQIKLGYSTIFFYNHTCTATSMLVVTMQYLVAWRKGRIYIFPPLRATREINLVISPPSCSEGLLGGIYEYLK